MRLAATILSFLIFANASIAKETALCKFEHECVGIEACASTDFEMDVSINESTATLKSDLGEITGSLSKNADGSQQGIFARTPSGDFHLLTITEGVARYSIHMPSSELGVYYLGTCLAK